VKTIILVSCCAEKLPHRAQAQELYQSQLFKACRTYAEDSGHDWLILSALHNVLRPSDIVEPYDVEMPTKRRFAEMWGSKTAAELLDATGAAPTRFICLAGEKYTAHLAWITGSMRNSQFYPNGNLFEQPLQGMPIGQRLRWLKQQNTDAMVAQMPQEAARSRAAAAEGYRRAQASAMQLGLF
jgi:hypothetical protein